VLNSYQDKCLDIIKLFDMFGIKHIPLEVNSQTNILAQQALDDVVSQGVFWVALVHLVEHGYALRSKGKLILEDTDRLWGKEKLILGNAKRLLGNTDRLSGKTEPESGRTESEPGKTELILGKEKPVLSNANQLLGNVDQLSGKAYLGAKSGSDKAESRSSGATARWRRRGFSMAARFWGLKAPAGWNLYRGEVHRDTEGLQRHFYH
jgi:hypothetical protein